MAKNPIPEKKDLGNIGKSNRIKKFLLIFTGTVSLGLGCLGIFLPVLPTTPFLLISAACFYRSSERLHWWLLNHKVFGMYIRNYIEGRGMEAKAKILTITLLWATIGFTAFFAVQVLVVQLILIVIAVAVTVHIIRMPTYKTG